MACSYLKKTSKGKKKEAEVCAGVFTKKARLKKKPASVSRSSRHIVETKAQGTSKKNWSGGRKEYAVGGPLK